MNGRKRAVSGRGGLGRAEPGVVGGHVSGTVRAAFTSVRASLNIQSHHCPNSLACESNTTACCANVAPTRTGTFGTGKVSDEVLTRLVREHFDLRPKAIIDSMDLKRPIYRQTAAYGHFGRDDLDVPWERTDKAEALAAAANELAVAVS